jgi:hypothetical protein
MFLIMAQAHSAASDVVVGIGLVNEPYRQSPDEQEATLKALQSASVRAIRTSIPNDDQGIAFAERVHAHGIKIEWLVYLSYKPGTPWPKPPATHRDMWHYPGLSSTDPDAFRTDFGSLLAKLEDKGIEFAGFELGNEINWTAFNADFSLPGQGKIFGLDDLYQDPEGRKIAQGFVQYLKSLAVLKDIRDHSKANQRTPVISAGLAIGNNVPGRSWNPELDGVAINATLDFLRVNGLDKIVDGYGVHTYPPSNNPGTPEGATMRRTRLEQVVMTECRPPGSAQGKPCWLTEWGFTLPNNSSCPVDESNRTRLIREMRDNFSQLARQGRLKGIFYFQWQGHIHAPREDPSSVFICGNVGEAGRLAVQPL